MIKNKLAENSYLNALRQKVLVFDGAMGTSLEKLAAEERLPESGQGPFCNDLLNLTYPQRVEGVHDAFLDAGADVIETNTFRSNRLTLVEFGLADQAAAINLAAARIARRCADKFSTIDHPRYVAGAMGPTGGMLSLGADTISEKQLHAVQDAYCQQAAALMQGGVDVLLLETQQDILEVKVAVQGIRQAMENLQRSLPLQVQVTLDAHGYMLSGAYILAALTVLEALRIDIFGINCSTDPDLMRQPLQALSQHCRLPLACQPNAGLPLNEDGASVYSLTPQDFSAELANFARQFGLSIVGGCCGTTPQHIRLLRDKLDGLPAPQRFITTSARLASAFHPVDLHQQPPPLIVGERLNTQGSRRFKRMLLEEDENAILELAQEQVNAGAHALDVCVALSEDASERGRMARLVRLLGARVDAPLVADSTDVEVMEAALANYPGRCLVNSVNLERGDDYAGRVLALAARYGAALIALTVDENGMALTASDKLAVAKRLVSLAVDRCGLDPADMVIDPLTLTLGSGSPETTRAGMETLEAIRLIKKELPGVGICLGVSNISYGLPPPARAILNSVFLYHAVQAGLDIAILDAAQVSALPDISERVRRLADDLIFNRTQSALIDFLAAVQDHSPGEQTGRQDPLDELPMEVRIRARILTRRQAGLYEDLDAYISGAGENQRGARALEALNTLLLPAMQEVGDQFGRGELILPFVLASAEIMQAASAHLQPYLNRPAAVTRGRVVLATVQGDVHDIGKNLVATILSNYGYQVIDLGKRVSAETIVDAAVAHQVDAVGLSALLVSTSQQMPLVAQTLRKCGCRMPVLIGGAAVNEEFARRINREIGDGAGAGSVYYCRDAFDAIRVLGSFNHPSQPDDRMGNARENLRVTWTNPHPVRKSAHVSHKWRIPQPPFWGHRLMRPIPLDKLFTHINRSALFRVAWGVRNAAGEHWQKYQREFNQRLDAMRRELVYQPWIEMGALYGYWPCQADGNELVLYQANSDPPLEIARLALPRQPQPPRRCLSDYFASVNSGSLDMVAFQIVTAGGQAVQHVARLQQGGEITEAFYAHGLAAQLTETAAQYLHAHIRQELGLASRQGKRYSWGYPALPQIDQHEILLRLLPAQTQLGIQLTSAYQFVPEHTTAAMILHQAHAEYFKIKEKEGQDGKKNLSENAG